MKIFMISKTSSENRPIRKRKKNIVLVVILFLLGFLVLAGGISVFVYNLDTDSEGYVYSNIYQVNTSTYAFTLYMNKFNLSPWGFLGPENAAQIKFIAASELGLSELLCEPTIITGMSIFSNIKLNDAAV